ncbi:MAG: hypothetical protein GEV09_18915 [Pseudonocardiaceae bacterium]|nr:hypothetical protein [Pseudonocardiaceae bacterium]
MTRIRVGCSVRNVTDAAMPQGVLPTELEALLAALMAGEDSADLRARADRLEAAMVAAGEIGGTAPDDLRSAIDLVRNGQPCPAVSALLSARSALAAYQS